MTVRTQFAVWVLAALLTAAGCSPSLYDQGRQLAEEQQFDEAIDLFYQEIAAEPASARAWREIGVARYQQGDLGQAEEALNQANRIKPDARTSLYLGLIAERRGDYDLAVRSYRTALGLNPSGQTRELLETYLDVLVQRQVEQDVKRALAAEAEIDPATIPANTVAVVEFDGSQLPEELAPLSLGMTEFTALDLAKIKSLQVVDRLKIETVRRELELGQSGMVDPATAPRVGKLVGGRRIVTGSMLALGDDKIRLSGAVVDAVDHTTVYPEDTEGTLEEFFRIQKEFVFAVVDEMGITLTPEERDAIQEVPTESYLAFMAYCRGLNQRNQGHFPEAEAEFHNATRADGNFSAAAQQGSSLSARLAAGFTGGGMDGARFEAQAVEAAEADLLGTALGEFHEGLLALRPFVPMTGEIDLLSSTADSPPRTGDFGSASVWVRGNLDGEGR